MKITLKDLGTKEKLKKYVIENGCFDVEENERIYTKWFSAAPRYLFRAANKKYHLTDITICDAGCSYGMNLVFSSNDSYGLEIQDNEVNFARSLGLNVYKQDIIKDDLSSLPKVDAVWNSAVLEHVDSPHVLLRKLWQLLKPNGLLVLYVPTMPPFLFLKHIPYFGKYFIGHTHGDHVSAFTGKTLRFTCESAGFETVEVTPFYPGAMSLFNKIGNVLDGCVYIGRKNENWQYPDNATRRKADNTRGYTQKH